MAGDSDIYDNLPEFDRNQGYGLLKREYDSRFQRLADDREYRNKVRAGLLTGVLVTSVFAGTVAFAGTGSAETAQPSIDAVEQLEPSAKSAFDALEP